MKKFSEINESVWSDIHSRSVGDEERKEDMINDSWGLDDMYDYICNHYKSTSDEPIEDIILKSTWSLTVPIFHYLGNMYLSLKPYNTYKLITCSYSIKTIRPFFEELCDKYTIKKVINLNNEWYEIYPKGLNHNHITNTFFIEMVDYFLNFDGKGVNKLFKKLIKKK